MTKQIRQQGIRSREKRAPIYSGALGLARRVVDSVVGLVFPGVQASMVRARMRNEAALAYEAAQVSRTAPPVPAQSADAEILTDLEKLRGASRQMTRDDAHAASAARLDEENIIGEGLHVRALCTSEETGLSEAECKAWNRACDAEFSRWADHDADATGHGTFYDLQRLVVRTRKVDGECLTHAVIGGDGLVACEVIDVDRLESPNGIDTNALRGGVELDPRGRPVAYHVHRSHPRDGLTWSKVPGRYDLVRLPREHDGVSIVQHVFRRERPGQTRGVPDLAACLPYLRHLHHYWTSELVAARVAGSYALFIKRQVTPTDPDIMPVQEGEAGQTLNFHETIEPGTISYLNEGEEPVPYSPNRPGTAFDPFSVRILRAVAAALGMSYEVLARDFRGLSWTSIRGMLLELRRRFDTDRATVCRQFCSPWYRNVILAGIAAGRLKPPPRWLDNQAAYLRHQWIPPAYGWVDPVKEIEASVAAINANLSTPYHEAGRSGLDAEQVLELRGQWLARCAEVEKKNGLAPGSLSGLGTAPKADAPGNRETGDGDSDGDGAVPTPDDKDEATDDAEPAAKDE